MNKKIVITGASRGIGRSIAEKLINDGHEIIGLARQFDEKVLFKKISIDLSDLEKLPIFLKNLSKEIDPDVLICNAGKGLFGSLEEFSYEQIRSLMDLNFLSIAYLIKAFLPNMKKRGDGEIILIGSESALQGKKKGTIYCASKFALRGFAQALRDECRSQNIRVTLINPGMVKTDFFKDLNFSPGASLDEHLLPSDVADLVSFILQSRKESVFEEINLSPQRNKILKKTIN